MLAESLAVFVVGVLIRIGIPLLLTVLVVWVLHRLDAHWQGEIEMKLEAQKKREERDFKILPIECWEVQHCSVDLRKSCRAFQNPQIPCWQQFRNGNGELRETCLECEVFRNAPLSIAA